MLFIFPPQHVADDHVVFRIRRVEGVAAQGHQVIEPVFIGHELDRPHGVFVGTGGILRLFIEQ